MSVVTQVTTSDAIQTVVLDLNNTVLYMTNAPLPGMDYNLKFEISTNNELSNHFIYF